MTNSNAIFHEWLYSLKLNVFKVYPWCSMYQYFPLYYCWIISHCMYMPEFFCWWMFGLFSFLAVMNNCAVNFVVVLIQKQGRQPMNIRFGYCHTCSMRVWSQLNVNVGVHFWTFSSLPLIYMIILCQLDFPCGSDGRESTVPHNLHHYSFVDIFKIGECESSEFVFLFQDCFGYCCFLKCTCDFQDKAINFCKNDRILIGIEFV